MRVPYDIGHPLLFADAVESYGHFIEYIPRAPLLVRVHRMVADAARDFDGKNPLRKLTAEMISP